MFVLTISRPSSHMGHVGSKTRSPGQIFGNSCLHFRGQICDPILMKLDQNVCFDNIGHVWIWAMSGQILGYSCVHSRGYICNPILMKLGQNVCLFIVWYVTSYCGPLQSVQIMHIGWGRGISVLKWVI